LDNTTTTTYTFTPTAGLCATTTTLTIIVNPNPATPSINIVQPTCIINTGSILINSNTNGLSFNLNGTFYGVYPANGFTGLAPGPYNLITQNAIGCSAPVLNLTINSIPVPPTAINFIITNSACGISNGAIQLSTVTGGTAPYTYAMDGGSFTPVTLYIGLNAGVHTIIVKDANGCTFQTTGTVNNSNGPTVIAVAVNATCSNNDGTITATAINGTPPYLYSINGINFQASGIFSGLASNIYTVSVKDANNCIGNTNVTIAINNPVTINAGTDKIICAGASVSLSVITNATTILWSPATGLSNPNIVNPVANPLVTTTYYVTAAIGNCTKTDTIVVFVNPAPIANAGRDTIVCFNSMVSLQGTGGARYFWSPPVDLSNTGIPNPVVSTNNSGLFQFLLKVTDANGCTSLKPDTVQVTVLPPMKVFAGNDTSIAVNQPMQLQALDIGNSGLVNYNWSPASGLNNAFVRDPVFVSNTPNNYLYTVTAKNQIGCIATDDIRIKVYLGPEIYVPTAFSPNNDGLNDIFIPTYVGIKELKYFSVFNRWGILMYTTTSQNGGWDGRYKGVKENASAFVWMVEGIDYNGNAIRRKGTVILVN
jgi:gliding motility-associated-like protein